MRGRNISITTELLHITICLSIYFLLFRMATPPYSAHRGFDVFRSKSRFRIPSFPAKEKPAQFGDASSIAGTDGTVSPACFNCSTCNLGAACWW